MSLFGDKNVAKRPEVRLKISLAKRGKPTWNKGNHLTEAWKQKIALGNKGKIRTLETRLKISNSTKGISKPEKLGVSWGKHTEEAKHKISLAFSGENHPLWIADRSKLAKKQERNDSAYREWRKNIRNSDNWKCRMLNKDCKGKLVAHHILPWSKFPELRYEVNNGITLCHFHHPRKRNDEMRLSPFFQELVATRVK